MGEGRWRHGQSQYVVLKYELIVQLQSVKIANGQFYDIQCSSAMCLEPSRVQRGHVTRDTCD